MGNSESAVFVVDDDAAFRAILIEYLSSLGYRVEAFSSAEQLMHHVRGDAAPSPSLLISDIHLERVTGLQLARELRGTNSSLPVILMTGFGSPEIEETAIRLGASAYLEKPFRLAAMRDLVREFLSCA
jgi:FixJ family two-component response regulator